MMTRSNQLEEVGELLGRDAGLLEPANLDRRTAIAAVALTAFFWAANFAIQTLRARLDKLPNQSGIAEARLVTTATGIVLCFGIHLIIRAMRRRPFWQRAVALFAVVPFAADACAWAGYLASERLAPATTLQMPSSSTTIQAIVYWVWFLLAWGALYLALRYSFEVQAAERRARQVQGLAHAAQMRALHNQINPHFMFNTLNSIATLILDGDRIASEAMVTRLADFLRATLAVDPLIDITLVEELRIQQLYLGIEEIRFPDMRVIIDSDAEVQDWLVPPLILQPLVENAVKHGVSSQPGSNAIRIGAHRRDDLLELTVANDRAAPRQDRGLGLGLQNVSARLASHYGSHRVSFEAGPTIGGGYRVTLTLPKQAA
jgi:two-component system, LytTR family, sensor kinase